eukprot:CAMPEP_0118657744 /NCGR_PEP_ID=MMETSP0785-20121206/14188_1 /TAXON_ID=91992 /ORGANISM="Bolidomonas pacifica, Strain CCMP 1866" /LENGTH=810 /DNA_ID=CAMNT_0006550695 /DNA_START=182 /DNA_END=2610 /DNA_ORIENTATION=-
MVVPNLHEDNNKRGGRRTSRQGNTFARGNSYSLQQRLSSRNMLGEPELQEAAEAQLILDRDDEDGEFIPRYIPANVIDYDSSSSDDEVVVPTEGPQVPDSAGEMSVASEPSNGPSDVSSESDDSPSHSSPTPTSPQQPKSNNSSPTPALPGSVSGGGSDAEASPTAVARKQSLRGKANWNKLRVAHKVGAALKQVKEDNRVFGVQNENDDNTDWATLHRQDFSKKPWYIILPNGNFRVGWDMYVGLLLLYVAAWVPYRVTFLGKLDTPWQIVEHLVDVSFAIDIFLNFFTGFYIVGGENDGNLCFEWKKISKKYCKSFFLIDFVATFPFDLVFNTDNDSGVNRSAKLVNLGKIMKLLRGLKLLRVYRLQKFIRDMETVYNVHHGISRMFNIILVVMLATHIVACIWYVLGIEGDLEEADEYCTYLEDVGDDTLEVTEGGWVCREGYMMNKEGSMVDNRLRYVASLYWAFSTLTTVGYGDISAKTVGEQLFSMLMMLLGVSWYAYVVGSMSTIMSSFDRQNKQIREKLECVNGFIRDAKLPQAMGKRVRNYFEYSLQKRNNGLFNYDADEILSELSAQLKNEIITWVERDLIERIPFFKGKSQSFVADCIQLFQPMVVHAGDFIIKEGAAADEMFFLIKGRAAIYYGQKKVKALVEGSYFGEIGCILGGIRRAGIRAVTTCELQCLNKRNLNNLLGEYTEVGEDLKKVARDRMKAVRTTQKQKNVTQIKKLLLARERRMSQGIAIPGSSLLSDLGSVAEEGVEEDNRGQNSHVPTFPSNPSKDISSNLSSSPPQVSSVGMKKGGLSRQLSV